MHAREVLTLLEQHLEAYRDHPEIQELMEAMQGIGKDPAAAVQILQGAARRLRARGEIAGAERIEEAARLLPQIAAGLMASGTTPADRQPIGGILLGLGLGIVPAVLLCWAAIYSMYGRTLPCERFEGRRVACTVTAGFLAGSPAPACRWTAARAGRISAPRGDHWRSCTHPCPCGHLGDPRHAFTGSTRGPRVRR